MQDKTGPIGNVKIELNAVIVALAEAEPQVLVTQPAALPSGPFATGHRTMEQGLRAWAKAKGGQPLGYVEQLYTFADRDRTAGDRRIVSIGYLALVRAAATLVDAAWSPWYRHFPWEDHRKGAPAVISKLIVPELNRWKEAVPTARAARAQRISIAFPKDMRRWNEELVLQRYELLWESGLVEEARGRQKFDGALGLPMAHDHRRILATAMARLRAKIKYRPVVFELMPDAFTLLQLQNAVEALAGLRLHKQNFRRLVESQGLVEETGATTKGAAGRPAKLFAFRREVLQERAAVGTKLPRTS
ncbi:MAG: hypothetical protein AB7H77_07085 [Bdellovibrionales bacterium]